MTKLGELMRGYTRFHEDWRAYRAVLDCPLMRNVPGALEAWVEEWLRGWAGDDGRSRSGRGNGL